MLSTSSRQAWLKRIEGWHEEVCRDQDRWRKRLEEATGYTASAIEQFDNLGGLGELVNRMADAGARWPPTSRDWEGYGVAWDAIPTRKVLQEVSDEQVRAALYFLNETAEQRDRVKAAVLLCEILGSSPDDFLTYAMFILWQVVWLGQNMVIPDAEHGGIQPGPAGPGAEIAAAREVLPLRVRAGQPVAGADHAGRTRRQLGYGHPDAGRASSLHDRETALGADLHSGSHQR